MGEKKSIFDGLEGLANELNKLVSLESPEVTRFKVEQENEELRHKEKQELLYKITKNMEETLKLQHQMKQSMDETTKLSIAVILLSIVTIGIAFFQLALSVIILPQKTPFETTIKVAFAVLLGGFLILSIYVFFRVSQYARN